MPNGRKRPQVTGHNHHSVFSCSGDAADNQASSMVSLGEDSIPPPGEGSACLGPYSIILILAPKCVALSLLQVLYTARNKKG